MEKWRLRAPFFMVRLCKETQNDLPYFSFFRHSVAMIMSHHGQHIRRLLSRKRFTTPMDRGFLYNRRLSRIFEEGCSSCRVFWLF